MLKTITLCSLTLLLLFNIGWSQERKIDFNDFKKAEFQKKVDDVIEFRADTTDVLFPTAGADCSQTVGIAGIQERWGFVSGTNEFLDLAKAQRLRFDSVSSYSVVGAFVWFGNISIVDDGAITLSVWDVASDGGPNSPLGFSDSLKVSELFPNDGNDLLPTLFEFSQPVQVNGPEHFIGVDLTSAYLASDTLAIFHTDQGCGDGTDTWELVVIDTMLNLQWFNFKDSWDFDTDLLIGSIIEFDLSTNVEDAFVKKNGLVLHPATPNPAIDQVAFNFELDKPQEVVIEIYQPDGKLLRQDDLGKRGQGVYTERLQVDDLPSGTYIYGIVTENSRLMSRFVVQR